MPGGGRGGRLRWTRATGRRMKTLWVLTAVLATGLHASARTRRLRAWTGGWYRARAVPRRGGRHERPGLGGSPLRGHCHASRGGLPLPARLSPLMGPIRRRPVGAVSTSDCAATPSLLFTYSAAFQAPSGHGHCSRFSVSFLVRALPGVSCGSDTDQGHGCREPGSLRYFMLPRSHLHPEPRRLVLRAGAT